MLTSIINEALSFADSNKTELYKKYFKCIPGGYGEGDVFAGIKNPDLKYLAKKNIGIDATNLEKLLQHKIHEIRLLALYIFQFKFNSKRTSTATKDTLIKLYLNNTKYINNWDLVDVAAYYVVGAYYYEKSDKKITELAYSNYLWDNRIAMVATFYHIRKHSYELAFKIAKILLHHKHDIIHKAVGWMLREIGNRDHIAELEFLKENYQNIPRTTLRYAIEKFEKPQRQQLLKGIF